MNTNSANAPNSKQGGALGVFFVFYGLLVTTTYSFVERCYRQGGFFALSAGILLASCICLLFAVLFFKRTDQKFKASDYIRAVSFSLSQILLLNGIFVSGISVSFGASVAGVLFAIVFSKIVLCEKIGYVDSITLILSIVGCTLLGTSLSFPLLAFLSGVLQGVTLVTTKKVMKSNSHSVRSISLSLFVFSISLAINGVILDEQLSLDKFTTYLLPFLGLLSMCTQVSYFLMCERYSSAYVGAITLTRVPWAILVQGGIASHGLGFVAFLIIIPIRYFVGRARTAHLPARGASAFLEDASESSRSKKIA